MSSRSGRSTPALRGLEPLDPGLPAAGLTSTTPCATCCCGSPTSTRTTSAPRWRRCASSATPRPSTSAAPGALHRRSLLRRRRPRAGLGQLLGAGLALLRRRRRAAPGPRTARWSPPPRRSPAAPPAVPDDRPARRCRARSSTSRGRADLFDKAHGGGRRHRARPRGRRAASGEGRGTRALVAAGWREPPPRRPVLGPGQCAEFLAEDLEAAVHPALTGSAWRSLDRRPGQVDERLAREAERGVDRLGRWWPWSRRAPHCAAARARGHPRLRPSGSARSTSSRTCGSTAPPGPGGRRRAPARDRRARRGGRARRAGRTDVDRLPRPRGVRERPPATSSTWVSAPVRRCTPRRSRSSTRSSRRPGPRPGDGVTRRPGRRRGRRESPLDEEGRLVDARGAARGPRDALRGPDRPLSCWAARPQRRTNWPRGSPTTSSPASTGSPRR